MPFDYRKLRGRIIECFGTIEAFAQRLGVTATTAGRKLSGKNGWTQDEIIRSCELLNIQPVEIAAYFFTKEVEFSQPDARVV